MRISPSSAVSDVPVSVKITGLPADETVTVRSSATEDDGTTWKGSAHFQVPSDGVVTLDLPSQGGSYTGKNPMGLFEFMKPPKTSDHLYFRSFFEMKPFTVRLRAVVDGEVVASDTTRRLPMAEGVTTKNLRPEQDGVYGKLFLPPHPKTDRPALLLFGGSEGGLRTTTEAAQIASHGYPVLALAYFKEPGLPQHLHKIPLEYFAKALRLLAKQPGVDSDHVSVMGVSRGSEAALLLGVHFPGLVDGVIAGSPSSVVNPAFPARMGAAWTLHGKALPHVSMTDYGETAPPDAMDAVIPVEKIDDPMLLICGVLDGVWPSCRYSAAIQHRVKKHHPGRSVTVLRFPKAGHAVGSAMAYVSMTSKAFAPTSPGRPGMGGTLEGNQRAGATAHQAILHFLKDQR